ncbi:MAG TPA: hypothetical protein VK476_03915 [Flavobacterium sp.]|nr:hypothetical protein [Flavobacterium sp.]
MEHLLVPLVVGILFEIGFEVVFDFIRDYVPFVNNEFGGRPPRYIIYLLISFRLIVVTTGFGVAYMWIMYRRLNNEGKFAFDENNAALLEWYLKRAKSYFAVSATDLRKWFIPSSIKYFAQLANYEEDITFERILLFTRKDHIRYVDDHFIGKDAAKLFASWHNSSQMRLAYFESKDLDKLLRELDDPRATKFFSSWWIKKFLYRIFAIYYDNVLDFAFIEMKSGEIVVLRTNKERKIFKVDPGYIGYYEALVDKIKEKVYIDISGTALEIHPEHDFSVRAGLAEIQYPVPKGSK